MGQHTVSPEHEAIRHARWDVLRRVDHLLRVPMIVLSFLWLGVLILDFISSGHNNTSLTALTSIIWAIFVLDFLLEFVIAPHKLTYLRTHWLTVIALVLPALRVFALVRALQILRAARAVRSIGLLRMLTSLNRGMGALAVTLGRRGVGFVVALTVVVTFVGAAGMAYFESPASLRAAGFAPPSAAGAVSPATGTASGGRQWR